MNRLRSYWALLLLASMVTIFWFIRIWWDRPETTTQHARDLYSSYLPHFQLTFDELNHGRLPLWNPYEFVGMPLFATLEYGPLYPLTFLYALGPLHNMHLVSALVHLILLGAFTYFFLRSAMGTGAAGALFGAAVFVFSGWAAARAMVYPDAFRSGVYIPLVFLCVHHAVRNPGTMTGTALALVFAIQFFAGEMEIVVRTGLLMFPYTLVLLERQRRRGATRHTLVAGAATMAAAPLGALGLAAVQWLPTLELSRHSLRTTGGLTYAQAVSPEDGGVENASRLLELMVTDGGAPFIYYVGALALVFALYALLRPRAETIFFAVAGMVIFGLILGDGFWLYRLYYHMPTGDWFRFPLRFQPFLVFCIAVLAGVGLHNFLMDIQQRDTPWRYVPAVFMLLSGLFLFGWQIYIPTIEAAAALFAALTISAALALYWRIQRQPVILLTIVAAFGGVLYIPLTAYDLKPYNAPQSFDLAGTPRDLNRMLRQERSLGQRAYVDFTLPDYRRVPKFGTINRVPSIDGFSPFMPKTFWDFIKEYRAPRLIEAAAEFEAAGHDASLGLWGGLAMESGAGEAFNILGVRYLIIGLGSELAPSADRPGESDTPEGYLELWSNGPLRLLENPTPRPRAFLLDNTAGTPAELVDRFDQGVTPARLLRYRPNWVVAEIPRGASGLLVLTDQHYPGWRAFAGGRPIPIQPVAGLFRGVMLTEPVDRVEFHYRPASFRWGLAVSLVSGVTLLAIGIYAMRRQRVRG